MGLALDEPDTNEKAVPVNGLDVLIADELRQFTEESVVDFISSPHGAMFTVESGYSNC